MAKYGIDRALLAAERPETDRPADRFIDVGNPWARVQAHLLCRAGVTALRCQCVLLPGPARACGCTCSAYASDLERADMLYTSLLVQMWHGLAAAQVPAWSRQPAGLAAELAAGLRGRGSRPGPRRRAGRPRPGRPARGPARRRRRRWCWPTASWSSAGNIEQAYPRHPQVPG